MPLIKRRILAALPLALVACHLSGQMTPATVVAQPEQAWPMLQSKPPAYCPVNLPADRGELHPKRLDQSRKVIHDRDEYHAYMAALKLPDPRQKAVAMEEFVELYPHSKVKTDALAQAMAAYQVSGNAAKVADIAIRLLQVDPDNLRALSIIVFLARDCATMGAIVDTNDAGKRLLHLAQRGLAALPDWQKEQGASLTDGEKLRDEMAAIFAGAAGLGELKVHDYAAARQFYEKALASDPKNLQDLYQLAITDLEMTPIDPSGFWYCGKAISIAQLQNKSAAAGMSLYCKAMFKKHGGKPEDWERVVSNTERDAAPPPDFAKSLSLQEPSQALQHPNPTSGNAAQLPPSEKGDPMSMLVPHGTSNDSTIGAGTGPAAARGMPPNERQGQRPEVISLSNNFRSNSDFGSRYGWYVDIIRRKVAYNWHQPTDPDSAGHRCTIAFLIQPDGSPGNVRIEQSSGVPALDESAIRAVQRIESFGPVPTHEKIAVEFWFDSRK